MHHFLDAGCHEYAGCPFLVASPKIEKSPHYRSSWAPITLKNPREMGKGKGRQREVTEEHSWQTTSAETLLTCNCAYVPSICPLAATTVCALACQVL